MKDLATIIKLNSAEPIKSTRRNLLDILENIAFISRTKNFLKTEKNENL